MRVVTTSSYKISLLPYNKLQTILRLVTALAFTIAQMHDFFKYAEVITVANWSSPRIMACLFVYTAQCWKNNNATAILI